MGERVTNNQNGSKVTTQVVWLCVVVAVGMIVLVLGLAVLANWSDGAIIAMFSGFGTLATGLILAVRNQQKQAEVLDQLGRQLGAGQRSQAQQLQTITKQTNGLGEEERAAVAEQAASRALEQHTERRAA